MEGSYLFLSFDGLDAGEVIGLQALIHPANLTLDIEFPWSSNDASEHLCPKAGASSLNVHAPAFEATCCTPMPPNFNPNIIGQQTINPPIAAYTNGTYIQSVPLTNNSAYYGTPPEPIRTVPLPYTNGQVAFSTVYDPNVICYQTPKPFNGDHYTNIPPPLQPPKVSSYNLNPNCKPFMPSNIDSIRQPEPLSNGPQAASFPANVVVTKPFILQGGVSTVKEASVVEKDSNKASQVQKDEQVSVVVKGQVKDIVKTQEDTVAKACVSAALEHSDIAAGDKASVSEIKASKSTPVESSKTLQEQNSGTEKCPDKVNDVKQKIEKVEPVPVKETRPLVKVEVPEPVIVAPVRRSWADIVSKGQKPSEKLTVVKPVGESSEKLIKKAVSDQEVDGDTVAEDGMALALGKHLLSVQLNYQPVLLQPRGIINRRNWCYINATLQALLACSPFYSLLHDLPLGPGVEREKSSTPVIDSMVKVAYEFQLYDKPQEELQVGQAFQPDFIYDMLRDLKSDCLKGQQEDAEEFLSFILNGMHEEMVKVIKFYEKKNHIEKQEEAKENGCQSDGEEEEWQVIGSKHKGMVTRKVAEHKTPISDLLGGQIKSFLTTSGNKTSASIQPFFTLQLDVQSENVNSVSEALKEMRNKEPIQGYTCAKTKQEVEAFSHIAIQKLPPILILHLKRFVYNKNGGCKKVMKQTDYPIQLEISRDVYSPDMKKGQRLRQYRLFAVMYHDGEEAIKGHYISDVYNHGSQTWVRCDDRSITAVTEEQVLSYSPPRVPYLLFYSHES